MTVTIVPVAEKPRVRRQAGQLPRIVEPSRSPASHCGVCTGTEPVVGHGRTGRGRPLRRDGCRGPAWGRGGTAGGQADDPSAVPVTLCVGLLCRRLATPQGRERPRGRRGPPQRSPRVPGTHHSPGCTMAGMGTHVRTERADRPPPELADSACHPWSDLGNLSAVGHMVGHATA